MKQLFKNFIVFAAILLLHCHLAAQVKKIAAIGITVSDMEKSIQFYHDVLDFKKSATRNYMVRHTNNCRVFLDYGCG